MKSNKMTAMRVGGAAVALVAAAAGTVVTAPAHADGLAATSISVRALQPSVAPGGTDTVTGYLAVAGGSGSGRSVSLEAHTPGTAGYTPVGTVAAGTNGGLSLAVTPAVTTVYRWTYDGATDARSSNSGSVRVAVTEKTHHAYRLGTTLSIRATKRVVGPAGVATVRGHLRSGSTGLPHRQVVLLGHTVGASAWHFVKTNQTAARGGVIFRVSPDQPTVYRMQFLGSQVFRPSHSGTVTVGVRSSVSISASPKSVDPGQITTVTATATHKGLPVSGASAQLLARAGHSRNPRGHFHVVGSGTTSTTGTVAFLATPSGDTVYRVRVLASAGAPGGLSPATSVNVTASTSLSIRGRDAAHHTRYAISGNLRSHGHALRYVGVTLWSQAPGTTVWTHIGEQRTGYHGGVSFTRDQAAGTAYRLMFAGNQQHSATTSGTVVN